MREADSIVDSYCVVSFGKDMRSAVRYSLQAKAIFSWIDVLGNRCEGRGYTRDISPRGAFIICQSWPPTDASLSMTILLPQMTERAADLRIEAEGKVLRVELKGIPENHVGFAVQNQWMRYGRSG